MVANSSSWDKKDDAWKVEASDINVKQITDEEFYNYFIVKDEVKDFIQLVQKKIIQAPKGYGKTLFLRKKASNFIKKHPNETFPRDGLCEDGKDHSIPILEDNTFKKNYYISEEDLKNKSRVSGKISNIKNAWMASIIQAAYDYVNNVGGKSVNKTIASFRNNLSLSAKELEKKLNDGTLQGFDQECYIFIDNIDRMVDFGYEIFLSDDERHIEDIGIFQFWVAIQVAFCLAINELPKKHIHVYGAVRHEALSLLDESYFEYADLTKLQRLMTCLDYNKNDIEKIYFNNIALSMGCSPISKNEQREAIVKYYGLRKPVIFNGLIKKNEKLFDYLYRHTLYKPRDIVNIGYKIRYTCKKHIADREEFIKMVVHEKSLYKSIVGDYLTEIGSPLQGKINVLANYNSDIKNILTINDLKTICRWINRIGKDEECDECIDCDKFHYFCYLYNAGLLGVEKAQSKKVTQKFQLPHQRDEILTGGYRSIHRLRKKDYFFLHPLLYGRAKFSANTKILIGDGDLFYKIYKYGIRSDDGRKYNVSMYLSENWKIKFKVIFDKNFSVYEELLRTAKDILDSQEIRKYLPESEIEKVYEMASKLEINRFSTHIDI
ncbi:hypothetical protein [Geothermobacter hydrogeniphilus]|uniref:Uncharacterized protein n=1 Tax=Geothermobacter hydrogeniphilus TaxID=1969733 RepID=A0A1X0Y0J6_9BACT|nr:hypothetical protein [Geothermobacter hydrogeniphilus]ORJ58614.1 hypothetical protein B5V00_12255 [Geothermobacter hydrogeniphilus]